MAALDLTEIAAAQAGPNRDEFELFAREALHAMGFVVVSHPDRGPDAGRDIIVEEERVGPGGKSIVRWLVSCKHKAHSGLAVGPADEMGVRDRIETHACQGFIAFYSTVPSSGLAAILSALKPKFEYLQMDSGAIERALLESPIGSAVAARYMPISYGKWVRNSVDASPPKPLQDPHGSYNRFFLREPHSDFFAAQAEAEGLEKPLLIVVYDHAHRTHSKLDHSLGYFMEYETTKRLVQQHFVPLLGPSSMEELGRLVPVDDPLENCLLVIMKPDGEIMLRESVYANPDEGLKRVRSVITRLA